MSHQHSNQSLPENEGQSASIGNASNPLPQPNDSESMHSEQLLGKEAEKYLREVASIEDVPDAQDQQELDEIIDGDKE